MNRLINFVSLILFLTNMEDIVTLETQLHTLYIFFQCFQLSKTNTIEIYVYDKNIWSFNIGVT